MKATDKFAVQRDTWKITDENQGILLFDEGKTKCRAHRSMNKSGRVHRDLVEYTPKQI